MTAELAPPDSATDIAIVGMAGRFPGSRDVDEMWRNLRAGRECVTWFSPEELLAAGEDPELIADPAYVPAAAVLDDIDLFDAAFFGYGAQEAALMDPQQRLFLEGAWHALEDAGIDPDRAPGLVGVFAGCQQSTYMIYNLILHKELVTGAGKLGIGLGNDKDSLTSRVAHKLGLTGPAFNVQAYCATSLVAVSVACSSLLTGECDVALAGGVAVEVPHRVGYLYQPGGISSSDGRCRSFDATGEGTPHGTGNGLGVVVLRRLADAVADRDRIYGVIRGWAVNHDGAAKAAFTAPGVAGQSGVVAEALAAAGLDPSDVDYLEAHGTGTALGDTVEVAALQQVFTDSPLAIGSTKPNFGHLDRAAGVAGLIKVALSLTHDEIPPTINHERPNEQLARSGGRIEVVTSARPWPRGARPRRAGVSAFGLGGANAHVVVEEAPEPSRSGAMPPREHQVLVWSARTEEAADAAGERLAAMLAGEFGESGVDIADVAFTLQVGRKVFPHRRAVVVSSAEDAVTALRSDRVRSRVEAARGRAVTLTGPEEVVGEALTCVRAGDDVALAAGPGDRAADVLAELWLSGVDIDWHAHHEGRCPRKVAVPRYGFQRTSYWIDPPTDAAGRRAV
ncbi:type I polyketide synthase [Actinophytocola sp.]|uniref:type I polyketide synthase n=1 Tax=Actinophytocola sp. TaxID=1872138 RepID=UPI002D6AEF8A|nr:beta-ketoacyl synthase N-terminal-like domain-containing protein [Actinophytocola sp.]HYQ65459.1 beta-ketoacyl synthase N-terminal-like domain-containing protein [Actinophytocola sp.]